MAELLALVSALLLYQFLVARTLRPRRERDREPFRDSSHWLSPPHDFHDRQELRRSLSPRLGWDAGATWLLWLQREEDGTWAVRDRWRREGGRPQSISLPQLGDPYRLPRGLESFLMEERPFLAAEQWDPYWAGSILDPESLPYCKDRDWSLLLSLRGDGRHPALLIFGPREKEGLYGREILKGLEQLLPTLELLWRNLSLLERVTREKQLSLELEVARSIQRRLLPKAPPVLPGIELAGRVYSSSEVGGDYFDFLELPENRLGLALGDATGHGIPAALLISSVALAFRSQAGDGKPPEEVLGGMNHALASVVADHSQAGVFAGFVYSLLDLETLTLSYSNGGLPAPWLLRADGRQERLARGGQLLGLAPTSTYQRGVIQLRPGDLLFLRSDGVEDQENHLEEIFGQARLLEWLMNRRGLEIQELAESLIGTLLEFAGGRQKDDISFIFMRLTSR